MLLTWFFAGVAGAVLGLAELLSRYRDAPRQLWKIKAFYLYLAINAALAMISLVVLQTIGSGLLPTVVEIAKSLAEKAGETDPSTYSAYMDTANRYLAVYQVLAAGFGGAAFFRASLIKSKIGGVEIGLGPSFVIDIMLMVTDREIDRARARERSDKVPKLMRKVPSSFAASALTDYCTGLLQNLSAAEREELKLKITATMQDVEQDSPMKSIQIGLFLVKYLGIPTLEKAVDSLDDEIKAEHDRLARIIEHGELMSVIAGNDEPVDDGED